MRRVLGLSRLFLGTVVFFLMATAHAKIPMWTFTPLTATTLSVPANTSATVSYTVTNQSKNTITLQMRPIHGITASGTCLAPIGSHQSCTLNLLVTGSALEGNINGGPVLCNMGNPLQCYQPSLPNSLHITAMLAQYTITPSTDGDGIITPDTPQTVVIHRSISFTATPNTNFVIYQWLVDGIIVQTGGSNFILSDITANHTVEVTFTSSTPLVVALPTTLDLIANNSIGEIILTNESPLFAADISQININQSGTNVSIDVGTTTCTNTLASNSECFLGFLSGLNPGTATVTISGTNIVPIVVTINVGAIPHVTLTSSISNLALSVKNTAKNAALTGHPRQITITNTDLVNPAYDVAYIASPDLPTGTTIAPASCGNMPAGATCVLTITPGPNPSALPGNISPTPITLSVAGDNTNILAPTLNILTYGSVYQKGYIFAVNDSYASYPIGVSIGGKAAALTFSSNNKVWDSSPNCTSNNNCVVLGANSSMNGTNLPGGNTYFIYNKLTTIGGLPASSYAAGLCTLTISGYSDWYLPAICEMGYATLGLTNCGTINNPALQNIASNLVNNGNIGNFTFGRPILYWSSTEQSARQAWNQAFSTTAQGNFQSGHDKGDTVSGLFVRCVRGLTP